ncbi:hypothetical protein MUK42_29431 [Musa troglodytarum]|uniref:Uncharacterized protein n=1 Tax=Musa troglodytarum TaxID=320322 RepID=A0A9E7FYR6_9LILI|nr:hypothetical protein MUK42_29431 [Musa troglodytarum]
MTSMLMPITVEQRRSTSRSEGKASLIVVKLEPLDVKATHKLTVIADVFKEFTNIMPPELPNTLPPHKGMDYRIKLEPQSGHLMAYESYKLNEIEQQYLMHENEMITKQEVVIMEMKSKALFPSLCSRMAQKGYPVREIKEVEEEEEEEEEEEVY